MLEIANMATLTTSRECFKTKEDALHFANTQFEETDEYQIMLSVIFWVRQDTTEHILQVVHCGKRATTIINSRIEKFKSLLK